MTFEDKQIGCVNADKVREHKDLLVQSVRMQILPVLIGKGFNIRPRPRGTLRDGKNLDTFPFDILRRDKPDGDTDLVEIQFMTYGRAAFRINACSVPKEGMMTIGGRRIADALEAGGLHDHFEMYSSATLRRWFSLWFWRLRKPLQSDYDRLALQVAGLLPEIELALCNNKLGPHMRRITIPKPAANSTSPATERGT